MLTPRATGESGAMNFNQMQDTAMNLVETVCSALCRPAEMIIRPWHGTRYFPVHVVFLSTIMMIGLPVFSMFANGVGSMLPFAHVQPPLGLFGIGSLSKLYFLLGTVHGVRHYWRMIDMSRETNSQYEGAALFFFRLIPGGSSFWVTRIVLEPMFLLLTAGVLERLFIFESGLATYFECAALALAMKSFIGWYRAWEYIRNLMDMRFAAPIVAKLADNRATQDDLAVLHLASFPEGLAPDIREAAVAHIAHAFTPEGASGH